MARTKIKLNRKGVGALLKCEETKAMLENHAKAIAMRCGTGYGVSLYKGKTRENASVGPQTDEAFNDNLKNNTVLKSIK